MWSRLRAAVRVFRWLVLRIPPPSAFSAGTAAMICFAPGSEFRDGLCRVSGVLVGPFRGVAATYPFRPAKPPKCGPGLESEHRAVIIFNRLPTHALSGVMGCRISGFPVSAARIIWLDGSVSREIAAETACVQGAFLVTRSLME